MAAGIVLWGIIVGTAGALVNLATGGSALGSLIAYVCFGQVGITMLMSGAMLRFPFRS